MSAIVNPVNFQMPTGGSFPQNFTITDPNGPGLTPDQIIVILSGHRPPTALGAHHADGRMSFGASDFSTSRSLGVMMENNDAAAAAATGYRVDTATVIQLPSQTSGSVLEVEAPIVSRSTNSVTLQSSSDSEFYGLAIFVYGTGVRVLVHGVISSGTVGVQVADTSLHTAHGVAPDVVIAASVQQTFVADGGGAEATLLIGWATRANAAQMCIASVAEHQQSNTSVGGICRNDQLMSLVTSNAGTVAESTRVSLSWDTNGYTLTTGHPTLGAGNATPAIPMMMIELYLDGTRVAAVAETVAASTTGVKSVTSPGFPARTVVAGALTVASFNTVGSANNAFSIGAATVAATGVAGFFDRDNRATSESASVASQTTLIDLLQAQPSHDWIAELQGMISNGFEIDVLDAAAASRPTIFLVFGQPQHRATFNVTQAAATADFDAELEFRSTFGATQAAPTTAFTAALVFRSLFVGAQPSPTTAFAAELEFRASFGITQALATGSAAAALVFRASFGATQGAPTAQLTAELEFRSTFGAAQTVATAAVSAELEFRSSFDATQGVPTTSFTAVLADNFTAQFGATQAAPTTSFTATFELDIVVFFDVTQAVPTIAFAASIPFVAPRTELEGSYVRRVALPGSHDVEAELAGSYDLRTELLGDF